MPGKGDWDCYTGRRILDDLPEDNRGEADGDETDDTADFVLDAVDSLTDEQLSALKARIAEREKGSASGAPQADGEKETDEKKTDEEKTEE